MSSVCRGTCGGACCTGHFEDGGCTCPERSDKPGMQTVRRHLDEDVEYAEDSCHRIATELRGEINGLAATLDGPVSYRPGKTEIRRREARIDGMKFALALALGLPLAGYQEAVDAFLEEFRDERLASRQGAGKGRG